MPSSSPNPTNPHPDCTHHTHTDIAGFRNGHCITIASKSANPAENKRTMLEMLDLGCDTVREMPVSEAVAAHRAWLAVCEKGMEGTDA